MKTLISLVLILVSHFTYSNDCKSKFQKMLSEAGLSPTEVEGLHGAMSIVAKALLSNVQELPEAERDALARELSKAAVDEILNGQEDSTQNPPLKSMGDQLGIHENEQTKSVLRSGIQAKHELDVRVRDQVDSSLSSEEGNLYGKHEFDRYWMPKITVDTVVKDSLSHENEQAIIQGIMRVMSVAQVTPIRAVKEGYPRLKYLSTFPRDIHIHFVHDRLASVNIESGDIYLAEDFLNGDDTDTLIPLIAHEVGHLVFEHFVKQQFIDANKGDAYQFKNGNKASDDMAPLSEVFADYAAMVAVGAPDAISAIMPEGSLDSIVRNFEFHDFTRLNEDPEFLEAKDRDVHISSLIRHAIYVVTYQQKDPEIFTFAPGSLLDNDRLLMTKVLNLLSPIMWLKTIIDGPDRPLKELVATLALKIITETVKVHTEKSLALERLYRNPELMLELINRGEVTVTDWVARSPALLKKLIELMDGDERKAVNVVKAASYRFTDWVGAEMRLQVEGTVKAIESAGGNAFIEREVELAKSFQTRVRTETVSGGSYSQDSATHFESTPAQVETVPVQVQAQHVEQTIQMEAGR